MSSPSDNESLVNSEDSFKLHKLSKQSAEPIVVSLILNGKTIQMEVDTGAVLSVISEATRKKTFSKETLHLSELALRTYTDEPMQVVGTINVKVQYGEQNQKLVLVVVKGDGPSLLGRNWLKYIRLDWHNIFSLTY